MKEDVGVIVGADMRQEWLLPWWWKNFKQHNRYPVAFVDFGLSAGKKEWCRERGALIPLSRRPLFVKDRDEVDGALAAQWESRYCDTFWQSRMAWFRKPHACLLSPYQRTLWIDLDCEIVGPLEGIWNACDFSSGIALAKDSIASTYNSGVIAFEKNHPLLQQWAKQSVEKNGLFRGDQDLLSQIIADERFDVAELPAIYNWNVGHGEQKDVLIYHWLGEAAKSVLQNKLIFEEL